MSFSEIRSFLISKQIGSGRTSLPSKEHARFRTVSRYWDERFLLYEPILIAFGYFYQGMPKLRSHRVPRSRRLLLLPLTLRLPNDRVLEETDPSSFLDRMSSSLVEEGLVGQLLRMDTFTDGEEMSLE
jgi:hypothetical protein